MINSYMSLTDTLYKPANEKKGPYGFLVLGVFKYTSSRLFRLQIVFLSEAFSVSAIYLQTAQPVRNIETSHQRRCNMTLIHSCINVMCLLGAKILAKFALKLFACVIRLYSFLICQLKYIYIIPRCCYSVDDVMS